MTDPAEIAKGLTEAQRRHLPTMRDGIWNLANNRGGMYLGLAASHIVERKGPREAQYRITQLGISVRAVLQEKG
jgi:hypothetical protein